jgi:hypothetical protein
MKRAEFVREIEGKGCELLRHGSRHDVYINTANGRKAPVPRHSELKNTLCREIRKELGLDGGKE